MQTISPYGSGFELHARDATARQQAVEHRAFQTLVERLVAVDVRVERDFEGTLAASAADFKLTEPSLYRYLRSDAALCEYIAGSIVSVFENRMLNGVSAFSPA